MSDISFGISGENAEFLKALKSSQDAVKEATEQMSSSFEGISNIFEKITGALGVFSAALAGGAAFKEAIDATVELSVGAMTLGRQFGISATQASDLRVALDDVHVSTETFSAAGNALIKTLSKNEEAFTSVGIATRDASGELRNQLDILLDATDHLAKLREGTDRNVEGQRLFGRAWQEVSPVVKLTSEVLRDATTKAQALGLEVGTEQIAATQRYRAAMNDVHDVLLGVMNTIGQALMPALSTVGEWFGSIGPGLVEAFRLALAALLVPFRAIGLGLEVIYETGKAVFTQLAEYAITFAQMFNKALHGDFKGAGQAWREGMGRIEQIGNEYWEKIAADAQATQEKIVNSFAEAIVGPKVTPATAGDGGAAAESEAQSKRAMEILRERIRLGDQNAQMKLKEIEFDLDESGRFLEGEQRKEAAMQREIELTRQQIRLNDQSAAARLRGISLQLEESGRFLSNQERMLQTLQQRWSAVSNAMSSALASSFRGMATGAMSFGDAMRNMFTSIADAAIQQAAKNISTMLLQAAVGGGIRSAEIRKDAGAGAAAAYKAIVGIPYVGPFLAPAAAAVAYAGILAFDSAEGGYDIPGGVNPMTQLHEREMVLPAPLADVIRNQAGGRGGSGTVHIHAKSGSDVLTVDSLVSMLKRAGMQFKLS